MSGDRHIDRPASQYPEWQLCKHCRKPINKWWKCAYGSNACKQAAYRRRLEALYAAPTTLFQGQSKARSLDPVGKRIVRRKKGGVA